MFAVFIPLVLVTLVYAYGPCPYNDTELRGGPGDDLPPDVKQRPYCVRCLNVVDRYCELTRVRNPDEVTKLLLNHPHCAEFLTVNYRTLCQEIGAHHLCHYINDTIGYARCLVENDLGTPTTICKAIEMC